MKERTIKFGDVSKKLLNNSAFWKVYLPIYRADYSIISKFVFDNLTKNIDVPATVFYSETDTPYLVMKGWNKFYKDIEFISYKGSLFFKREHTLEMADDIASRLENI